MDLSGALLDEVILEVYDEEWVQTVDYEHIPFRCHKCHEHGHLFRDRPLSKEVNKSKTNTMKEIDSFQKVVNRGKGGKRGPKQPQDEGKQFRQNRFQVLQEEEEITKSDQAMEGRTVEKEKEENRVQTQNIEYQKEATMSDVEQ